ncbi:unnamed protein product [Sphenostylis stenocarpa]|uniref:Uncharacterized protein n=1 Tax=Sphenostylis stenocarpa TaxID=92480 RepID=A0AA86SD84_9FABA|nr:unnamed protein product [Sphenostylis stenocarpa]
MHDLERHIVIHNYKTLYYEHLVRNYNTTCEIYVVHESEEEEQENSGQILVKFKVKPLGENCYLSHW